MESYSDETVRGRLETDLPKWKFENNQIVRSYATGDWRRGQLLVGAIAYIAEAVFHHPDVEVTYPRVIVKLTTHDAGGVTERDLELARMIEQHVSWRPSDDSIFAGPPDGWIE